jgi:hypothetical protein
VLLELPADDRQQRTERFHVPLGGFNGVVEQLDNAAVNHFGRDDFQVEEFSDDATEWRCFRLTASSMSSSTARASLCPPSVIAIATATS